MNTRTRKIRKTNVKTPIQQDLLSSKAALSTFIMRRLHEVLPSYDCRDRDPSPSMKGCTFIARSAGADAAPACFGTTTPLKPMIDKFFFVSAGVFVLEEDAADLRGAFAGLSPGVELLFSLGSEDFAGVGS